MKTMKRILALSLALALAISLMPNVLQVKASTDAEATAPVVVWEDSFEVGEGGTFTTDGVVNQPTTADKQNHWNGAQPNADWFAYYEQDWYDSNAENTQVVVSGGVEGGVDGTCIKLDAADTNAKVYFYFLAAEATKAGKIALEDGEVYIASVWAKVDTGMAFRLMVQNVGDASNPYEDYKGTEWKRIFVPFTYTTSKNAKIGLQMLTSNGGAIYLDNLQIFKAENATGIVLDKETAELEPKQSLQLTAGLNPATATTKVEYTWSSDNTSAATVDQTGKVTAVADGTANITATAKVWTFDYTTTVRKWVETDTEWTAECEVTVASKSPIVVYEDSFEVGEGGTFTAIEDETVKITTADDQKNWNGAAPNNDKLFVNDWQAGSVIISGGVGGAWDGDSCIKMENNPASTETENRLYLIYNLYEVINNGKLTLVDGKMYVMSVWVKYGSGTTYNSRLAVQNTKSVDGGNINPWADDSSKSTDWVKVEVPFAYDASASRFRVQLQMQNKNGVGEVYFDLLQITEKIDATANPVLEDAHVEAGKQVTLKPAMTPADASTTVTWASSDPTVATVDANGVVTAVSAGTTTITATAAVKNYDFSTRTYGTDNPIYTATCEVTVTDTFSIDSACINLGEDLDMKFFVNPADLPEGPEGFTATIRRTYADDREDDIKENVALSTYSDGWYYVSYSGIVAKEMGDKIYVTIYDSEGNAVSKEWEDSVAKLAYRAIEDCTESGATEELNAFVALLNYGAAAQNTFDYDKTNLVNANLSAGQQTVATYTGEDASVGDASAELRLNESIMLKSFFATDVLESATSVKVSFTNYRNQPVEYMVTAFGEDAADNGAYKYVPVTGLVIADVDTVVTITIENAEGTITVQDSMASYVARAKAAGDNDPLYDAIMALGAAAKTYLLNK